MVLTFKHAIGAVVIGVAAWNTYKTVKSMREQLADMRARKAEDAVAEIGALLRRVSEPKTEAGEKAPVEQPKADVVNQATPKVSFSVDVEPVVERRGGGATLDGIPAREILDEEARRLGGRVHLNVPLQPGVRNPYVIRAAAANFDTAAGVYDIDTMSGTVRLPGFLAVLIERCVNSQLPMFTTAFTEPKEKLHDGMYYMVDRGGRHGVKVVMNGMVMALFQSSVNSLRFDWYDEGQPTIEDMDHPPANLEEFFQLFREDDAHGWVAGKVRSVDYFINVVVEAFKGEMYNVTNQG